MATHVLSAAKRLGARSNWSLTNLELQKLIYLAHMFFLGRTSRPLVSGLFQAWDYGPVHPDLYHKAKIFGANPVENIFHSCPEVPEGPESEIIDEVYTVLGSAGPARLVNATHRQNGAWDRNYRPGVMFRIIPNEDILKEYKDLKNGTPK